MHVTVPSEKLPLPFLMSTSMLWLSVHSWEGLPPVAIFCLTVVFSYSLSPQVAMEIGGSLCGARGLVSGMLGGRVCTHQHRDYWMLSTFWLVFKTWVVRSAFPLWSQGFGALRVGGMCLYSPALRLLDIVDCLGCFRGMGGEIDTSSVELGVW